MECLYLPENEFILSSTLMIDGDEFRHIKALHLRENSSVFISNGKGEIATAKVQSVDKRKAKTEITKIRHYEKPDNSLTLALGILDNRERFEFALEKAVELGVTDFIPVVCKYAQKSLVNTERLTNKAIAALKQSVHPYLINIHPPTSIQSLLNTPDTSFYFACEDAESPLRIKNINSSATLIVGPEGGFSAEETESIKSSPSAISFNMGDYRLRAETAAIVGISQLCYLTAITHY